MKKILSFFGLTSLFICSLTLPLSVKGEGLDWSAGKGKIIGINKDKVTLIDQNWDKKIVVPREDVLIGKVSPDSEVVYRVKIKPAIKRGLKLSKEDIAKLSTKELGALVSAMREFLVAVEKATEYSSEVPKSVFAPFEGEVDFRDLLSSLFSTAYADEEEMPQTCVFGGHLVEDNTPPKCNHPGAEGVVSHPKYTRCGQQNLFRCPFIFGEITGAETNGRGKGCIKIDGYKDLTKTCDAKGDSPELVAQKISKNHTLRKEFIRYVEHFEALCEEGKNSPFLKENCAPIEDRVMRILAGLESEAEATPVTCKLENKSKLATGGCSDICIATYTCSDKSDSNAMCKCSDVDDVAKCRGAKLFSLEGAGESMPTPRDDKQESKAQSS